MGEAKRRREQNQKTDTQAEGVDFARVASAVNRLTFAASGNVGTDCILQASLARAILERLGVAAELCFGFSAWRIGDGDGDVLSHVRNDTMQPISPRHVAFHAWLRVGGRIFDVTTGQLRLKAAQLDAQDGGHTQVDWAPDYLLARIEDVSTYQEVAQGNAGLFFYQRDMALTQQLSHTMPVELDPVDVQTAWLLYENPEMNVIGPNNIAR